MKNFGSCVMKAFVWASGFVALAFGIYFLSVDSSSLIKTQAEMVSSTYTTTDDSGNESYNVTYTYQVDNVWHEDSMSSSAEYAPGEIIMVYYDPKFPDNSYASQGESSFLGIIGVVFGIYCIGSMGWGTIKSVFNKQKKEAIPVEDPNQGSG